MENCQRQKKISEKAIQCASFNLNGFSLNLDFSLKFGRFYHPFVLKGLDGKTFQNSFFGFNGERLLESSNSIYVV